VGRPWCAFGSVRYATHTQGEITSALASALLKLDAAEAHIPRADLRAVEARNALCIVEVRVSRIGRLSTRTLRSTSASHGWRGWRSACRRQRLPADTAE